MEHVVQVFEGWDFDEFDPFSAASIPSIGSAPRRCASALDTLNIRGI